MDHVPMPKEKKTVLLLRQGSVFLSEILTKCSQSFGKSTGYSFPGSGTAVMLK